MQCVICLSPEIKSYQGSALLEAQCSVIFFLKEFLGCGSPSLNWDLRDFLLRYGNPTDWLSFCGPCSKLVEEGKRVHQLLQQLQAKLQGLRVNLEEKAKGTDGEIKVKVHSKKNDLMIMVRAEMLRPRGQMQPKFDVDGPWKSDRTDGDDAAWSNEGALAKVKVEMDVEEEEIGSLEDFITGDVDLDEDDDDQLENVIYPEGVETSRSRPRPPDKTEDIQGSPDVSDSDEEYIPEETKSRKKTKSAAAPVSRAPHGEGEERRKSNCGPKKTPPEARTCPICSILFDKPSIMKRHLNSVHTRIVEISCDTCGKGFIRKDSLKSHICPNVRKDQSAMKVEVSRPRKQMKKAVHHDDDDDLGETSDTTVPPASELDEDQDSCSSHSDSNWKEKKKPQRNKTSSVLTAGVGSTRKSPLEVRTCPICAQVFDRPSFLAKHLRSRSFKNGDCGIDNDNEGEQSDSIKSLKCPVCSAIFESKSSFATHFQYHTTAKPGNSQSPAWSLKSPISARTCPHPECGKVFPSPAKLKSHLATQHKEFADEDVLLCSYCPKTFVKKSYLKDHEWFHLRPDEKLSYLQNMRSKVSLKDKTCPVCNLVFLSNSRMKVHLNNKHEKKTLWSCDVCLKGFTRKDSYEEHLKTHLDTEQREKLLAGVSVTVPSTQTPQKSVTLKLKVKNSGSISHRSCPTCGKVFSNRSRMTIHLKSVHEKSTTTICELCGISIGCKQTLRMHMKNHEKEPGIKDHICTDCGKGFRHRYSLRRHQLVTHNPKTDMRKFSCPVPGCGKAYPFRSLLVQHQKARHHFQQDEDTDGSSSCSYRAPLNNTIPDISHSSNAHQHYQTHNYAGMSFPSHFLPPPTQSHSASSNWNIF